jgi:hypothetical protein
LTDIANIYLQGQSTPCQAHNLKVVGSNPTPATSHFNDLAALRGGFFALRLQNGCTRFFESAGKRASTLTVMGCKFTIEELETFQCRFEAQLAGA